MFKVAYIKNADPVFFSELDTRLAQCLRDLNVEVTMVELEDVYFEFEAGKIQFFHKNQKIEFDGILNWGYMSPKHMQDFNSLVEAVEAAGKVSLHTSKSERILQNKLFQGVRFAQHGVSIPKSLAAFSIEQIKNCVRDNFTKLEKGVVKSLDGYGGDGVQLARGQDEIISIASKELWKDHQSVIQKFVPDSIGKSVRALCINGQLVVAYQYSDTGSDFRSNNGYNESFQVISKMDQIKKYEELALKAIHAIDPYLAVGGVDILESQVLGLVVLEVNGWADLWDAENISKVNTFQKVAESYYARLQRHYNKHDQV